MKRIALFLAIAAAAIACTNEETVTPELKVTSETADLVIPTEGGELTLAFNVNVDWTAEVKEAEAKEWCSLSPASGKPGDNTLKVIAIENEGTENRTVTVVLRALEATQEIVVTQLQKDALVLTGKKEFEVAYQGQNLEFAVSHNSELKATADVPWITEVKAKAVEESKLTFAVAANTGEARTGKITFEAGSLKEVVTVKQAAWTLEFTVTPAETAKTFEAEGGEYEVTVAANVEYTVTVPENDWLTVADAEGVYTFTAVANTIPSTREVEVKIAPKDEKHAEAAVAIKMNQKGAGAKLVVSPEEAEKWLGCAATSFDLTVDTNLELEITYGWDAEGVEPWISYTEAAGVYTFAVAENAGWNLRSAFVYITPKDEAYADMQVALSVFQAGHANKLWSKQITSYEGYDASLTVRLAKYGDKLLLANTTKVYVLNPLTGDVENTISLPDGMMANSLLVDDAGNLMVANDGLGGGAEINLCYIADPTNPSPQPVLTYNTTSYYSTGTGNFRVRGNIKDDAVITAYATEGAGGAALMWEVVDGVCGEYAWINPPYTNWNLPNLCCAPVGSSLADGLFYIGYGGDYNLKYIKEFTKMNGENQWVTSYETNVSSDENFNCISTVQYKGKEYAAILKGCQFTWNNMSMVLLDVDNPSAATLVYEYQAMYDVERDENWQNTYWTGKGAYSDVLLVPTDDALLMIGVDSNFGAISCVAIN